MPKKWQPIVKAELDTSVGESRKRGFWSPSWKDQADTYKLTEKPFTKALLLRASRYQDETPQSLLNGMLWPIINLKRTTFEEFTASCAITIACHITTEAIKNIGREAVFRNPVPSYAPMVVAYSLCLLAGIKFELQAEGIEVGWRDMAIITTGVFFFMGHTEEERVKNVTEGIKMFQFVAPATTIHNNWKDWRDSLMQLIPIYVLQWTTEKQDLKQRDFVPLFGSMLSSLLKTVE
jgi:hypothetical protein